MKNLFIYIAIFLCGIGVFFLQFGYSKKKQPYTFYQVYLDNEKIGVINSKEDLEKYISRQGDLIQNQVLEYQNEIAIINSVDTIMKQFINKKNSLYKDYVMLNNLKNTYNNLTTIVDEDGYVLENQYDSLRKIYNNLPKDYKEGIYLNDKQLVNYNLLKDKIDNKIKQIDTSIVNYLYNNRNNLNITSTQNSHLEEFVDTKLFDKNYSDYIKMLSYVGENEIYVHTNDIYEPLGISIKKITTYDKEHMTSESVYKKIVEKKPCTIEGYQFRIKADSSNNKGNLTAKTVIGAMSVTDYQDISDKKTNDIIIYVTDKEVFNDAIDEVISVFIGNDKYEAYKKKSQKEITDTGSVIDNIYLKDDITIKKTNISVKEKIYSDSSSLASYLLYGDTKQTKTVKATAKDTVDDLAYKNGISVEEFFLSNPSFTSVDNMFYDGQPITITRLNPKISLIVEESQVQDVSVKYNTLEKYDSNMTVGSEYVTQKGSNGVMRVSQKVQKINGAIVSVNTTSKETIKAAKDKIVRVGTKVIPNIGSVRNWGWPTNSYTLSSGFGYRISPFSGRTGDWHAGLDIPNQYGAPVYASNNGTIVTMKRLTYNYGIHIVINHNNGYYTLYGHMSGFAKGLKVGSVVSRGQVIGYVGSTGAATGPHVHFEIRVGSNSYSSVTNPLPYLRK